MKKISWGYEKIFVGEIKEKEKKRNEKDKESNKEKERERNIKEREVYT